MTAKELKEVLANMPDDAEVYIEQHIDHGIRYIPTDFAQYDRSGKLITIK